MTTFDQPDYVAGFNPGGSVFPTYTIGPVGSGGSGGTPVTNVSGLATLALYFVQFATGNGQYEVFFYADPLGITPAGTAFIFFKNTTRITDLVIPVQGPYWSMDWTNLTGGTTQMQVSGAGYTSAAIHSPKQLSGYDTLADVQGGALPGSGSAIALPTNPFGGTTEQYSTKCRGVVSAGQNGSLVVQVWNGSAWVAIFAQSFTALTVTPFECVLPFNDYRFQVNNGSASATTYNLTVVAED